MPLIIPIEQPTKQFKKHLEEEGNDRLIFSGAFGIGKTYFLDKFFENKNQYLAVKLAPVNYSISSNEDIFKLIKFDILFDLIINHGLVLDTESISWDVAIGTIIPAKLHSIVTAMLGIIPLLNKTTDDIQKALESIKDLGTILKEVKKERKEASQETDAINFIDDAVKMFQLETDYVTEFLDETLTRLASLEEGNANKLKLKVLIIDDLDRIDPEHIFRLFNIFSAHLDYNKSGKNKFGFDKVIFVCDIHNIRNIFHSKYGSDTDFTGYIDKFFSQEIFYFSNENAIRSQVDSFVKSIQVSDEDGKYFTKKLLQGHNHSEKGIIPIVLTELMLSGALKMRRLKNSYGMKFSIPKGELIVNSGDYTREISYIHLPGLVSILFLSRILGGGEYLARALKTTSAFRRSTDFHTMRRSQNDWLIGNTLVLYDYKVHQFKRVGFGNEPDSSYSINLNYIEPSGADTAAMSKRFAYNLVESRDEFGMYYARLDREHELVDSIYLFYKTVDFLLSEGVLK